MKREILAGAIALFASGCVTTERQIAANEEAELKRTEKHFLLHKCPELKGENQCVIRRVQWRYEGKWLNGSADGCVVQFCGDCTYVAASSISMSNTECKTTPIPPQAVE